MGILNKLREEHPGVIITAYDGHYSRIGDEQSNIISHLEVEFSGQTETVTLTNFRRKELKPRQVFNQLTDKISAFKAKAKAS